MEWTNLYSGIGGGLVGGFIGFLGAMYCQRWVLRNGIKTALRENLLQMKSFEFAKTGDRATEKIDYAEIYRNSFPKIYSLYLSYGELLICKRRLDKGWREYKGVNEKTEEIMKQTCKPPTDQLALERRIDSLIGSL